MDFTRKKIQTVIRGGSKRPYAMKHRRKNPMKSTHWKCPYCEFFGASSNSLNSHVAHHFMSTGIKCHLCTPSRAYSATTPHALGRHINRDHHPEGAEALRTELLPDSYPSPKSSGSDPDQKVDLGELGHGIRSGLEALKSASSTTAPDEGRMEEVEASRAKLLLDSPSTRSSGGEQDLKNDLDELDRDIRNGFEALKVAIRSTNATDERQMEEDSIELGRLLGQNEAVDRRLAELPELIVRAEIDLRKLQCAALKMRMWVLQQPVEVKEAVEQQPETIIEAGEELILQAETSVKTLRVEKARLEKEREDLAQSIRLKEEKSRLGHANNQKPVRMEEVIVLQRCRILHYYAAKQRLALTAFQSNTEQIHREQEESLKTLDDLLQAD